MIYHIHYRIINVILGVHIYYTLYIDNLSSFIYNIVITLVKACALNIMFLRLTYLWILSFILWTMYYYINVNH